MSVTGYMVCPDAPEDSTKSDQPPEDPFDGGPHCYHDLERNGIEVKARCCWCGRTFWTIKPLKHHGTKADNV